MSAKNFTEIQMKERRQICFKDMKDTIKKLREELIPIYGKGEAEAMIRLIFHSLKGWSLTDILINADKKLSHYIVEKIDGILARLKKHEPIQYILGETYFYGMTFKVGPGVLIPRQDTETLVDTIVKENRERDLRVCDLCTGSGCIAIALSRNLDFPHVTAIDISENALGYAKENAKVLHADISITEADIFTWNPKPESFDIIVSNPPYITESEKPGIDSNVKDYEPGNALFVDDATPLVFYSRICEIASEGLAKGGRLYLEINSRFPKEISLLLKDAGFSDIRIIDDIHSSPRFASARKG